MLLLFAASLPLCAQRQPHTFFTEQIQLNDSEIQRIDNGQVVTKVLDSGDRYGLLVFGAVYVNAPIENFVDIYRDVEKLQEEKVYLTVQKFGQIGSPPKLSDFDRLEIDENDIDELENCEPGDCDIQIVNIEEVQKLVDWNSPNKYARANEVARRRIYEGVDRYLEGGLRAFGIYRDREKPLDLYQATKDMVDRSYYLPKDKAPGIYGHVVEYPDGKMDGVEDIFYWENIDFGQGPTIRVNHVSLFPDGAGDVKFIAANKQLYASKYMRVALQMFYCVPDTQDPNKPGFYLIEMNDSRLPDFGRLKLAVVRRIATGKAEEATRDTLGIFQRRASSR